MALSLFGLATIAAQVFLAPVANDERALAARLVDWLDVLRRIAGDRGGQGAIRALSSYLLGITKLGRRRLQVVIRRRFGTATMKKFVSTLERERIEGRAEGRSQAKAETLLRQLQKRFGVVPAATRKRILSARTADLDRWFDRAIDAEGLAAVFRRA